MIQIMMRQTDSKNLYLNLNILFYSVLQQGGSDFQPVVVSRVVLKSLSRHDVIVCKWKKPLRHQYYKMIMPDVSITKCSSCNKVRSYEVRTLSH